MKIKQIIGRGVRRDSHMKLPPKDKDILKFIDIFQCLIEKFTSI